MGAPEMQRGSARARAPQAEDPAPPRGAGRIVIAGAVALAVVFAFLSGSRVPDPVAPGASAPGFALARVGGGGPLSLSDLTGRVVLLNFWATWCKPCEDEMPAMERLYRALRGEAFELVAISVDDGDEVVIAFRDRLQLSFPILRDADKQVAERYQTFRFPETLLIDRAGRIVERYVGPKDWDNPAYLERLRRLVRGEAERP